MAERFGSVVVASPLGTPGAQRGLLFRLAQAGRGVADFVSQKPLGAAGGAIIIVFIVTAILAPVIAPYYHEDFVAAGRLVPPGSDHLWGTDHVGRDIFSRVVYGTRVSLVVALSAGGLGTTLGGMLGLASAYKGGVLDAAVQRAMEVLLAFPVLVLAMTIVAVLGASMVNVIVAIGLVLVPQVVRVMRAQVLGVKDEQYVEAARAVGATDLRIMLRHVLPQCVAVYLILVTAHVAWAIIVEAALSFLGVGVPPPNPSWGAMMSGTTRSFWEQAPWIVVFPAVALSLAVFGANLFGDALRDVLDPRLRGTSYGARGA
ncbi:MAG: ABC transporter permease [Chloroflexi bacterium]|nr:ABC transporter permease [Chloroflexota bacterium]